MARLIDGTSHRCHYSNIPAIGVHSLRNSYPFELRCISTITAVLVTVFVACICVD